MSKTVHEFTIVGGPSKASIFDSLARSYDPGAMPLYAAVFKLPLKNHPTSSVSEITVRLLSVGYESGSPFMLLFTGHIIDGGRALEPESLRGGSVDGFYDAAERKGHVKITVNT